MDNIGSISKWKINLTDLVFIGDVLNYEGPMLSLFVDPKNNAYLFRWIKQDENSHKWQIFKVLPENFKDYFRQEISERELVLSAVDKEYLMVNIDPQLNYQHIHFMQQEELPPDYLPGKNAFFKEEWCPDFEAIMAWLKQGKAYSSVASMPEMVVAEPSVPYHAQNGKNSK